MKKIQLTDKLRKKIMWEYAHWLDANRSKNALFESQQDLFATKKNDELMKSNLFWSIKRTIQATCIINEPDVSWEDTDHIFQQEARNFSKMFRFDYLNNSWDFDKYIWIDDVCKYWKFIQLFCWWDKDHKVPIIERIDPRFVYPYNDWSILVKDYPFFWFDRVISKYDVEKLGVNKEWFERIINNYDEYIAWLKNESAFYRNIWDFYNEETWMVTIHYHYTKIEDLYYLVLMLGEVIVDIRDIPETKGKRIPIAVTWFSYNSADWWWESLVDIIEDSHRTEQLLLNLYKIKVTREATGGNIFIDEEIFMKNRQALKNQSIKNRWFPVKMRDITKPINSMVYELPQTQVSSDIYNSLSMVKNKAMAESFANASSQWLGLSDNSNPNTATQSKIQKINANMMTTLQNSIISYWSKDFADLYRDFILYWWRWTSEKVIRNAANWLSWTYDKLTPSKIKWNFHVVIEDVILKQIDYEEKKKAYTEQYNMLVNDPNTPPFLLRNIRRSINYFNWMDENQIDSVNELDIEEYQCKQDILMLNENKNIYIPVDCNLQMRLWYYNKAKETKAKMKAIEALKYIASQNLVQQSTPMQMAQQAQQPQLWWWFPWQDQASLGNTPTPKQPKIENPLTEWEKEQQLLQVGWMQAI